MSSVQLLDLKQVQQRLDVGRSSVYELVMSGQLRSVKIGKRRLVPENALTEFVEDLAQAAAV